MLNNFGHLFIIYCFYLFLNLVTLDLSSVTYLFQVFIFKFLWEEQKSDDPLILKSLNKIGKAGKVKRTK